MADSLATYLVPHWRRSAILFALLIATIGLKRGLDAVVGPRGKKLSAGFGADESIASSLPNSPTAARRSTRPRSVRRLTPTQRQRVASPGLAPKTMPGAANHRRYATPATATSQCWWQRTSLPGLM